jgi:hypothetical protein
MLAGLLREIPGRDRKQVLKAIDFTRGMPLESQFCLVVRNARTIVRDPIKLMPPFLISTDIWVEPASRAFSTSSFTTEAGAQ